MIAPEVLSGGLLAPIGTAPRKINSKVAPTIIPVFKSPNTNPTKGATIIGLLFIVDPQ